MSKRPTDESVECAVASVLEVIPGVGSLTSFQKLSGGYANLVYEVNGTYVLRVFFRRGWNANYEAERVALEMLRHAPKVPRLLASGFLPLEWSCPYLLLTCFQGVDAFAPWLEASPNVRCAWAKGIAATLRAAHSISLPTYGTLTNGNPTSSEDGTSWQRLHDGRMTDLVTSVRSRVLEGGARRLVDATELYYAAHRSALVREEGPRLVHGDVRLHNVIVEGNEVTGVVDWEWAHGGEREEDLTNLARFCLFPTHEASGVEAGATRTEYAPLLREILIQYPELATMSDLTTRLTIYLLEADLGQLNVNSETIQRNAEERLATWLEGNLIREIVQSITL